jgi:hypothetical protein
MLNVHTRYFRSLTGQAAGADGRILDTPVPFPVVSSCQGPGSSSPAGFDGMTRVKWEAFKWQAANGRKNDDGR